MRKIIFILSVFVGLQLNSNAQQVLKAGNILPNMALKSTNGTIYNLNEQKGAKGFILVFMTPTCDHCIAYENRVMALDKKYKSKGFHVVAVGPYGDDAVKYPLDAMPEMKKLAIKKGFTFPYVSDEKFKYTWLLGITKTPTAVVLQKQANGYLIKYIGNIDDEQDEKLVPKNKFVEKELNKMIAAK